jgi:ABC-type multidrug transport system permease subunit
MTIPYFVADEGIKDPNFLYQLGAQILLFILICIFSIWLIHKLLGKYIPNLGEAYKIIGAVVIVIALICIAGLMTQALGL